MRKITVWFPYVSQSCNLNGDTLLGRKVSSGNYEDTQKLLIQGVDVNQPNNPDKKPLMLALKNGRSDIAVLLLNWGAQSGIHDSSGFSAVEVADRHKDSALTALVWLADRYQMSGIAPQVYGFLKQRPHLSDRLSVLALNEVKLNQSPCALLIARAASICDRFQQRRETAVLVR